MTVNKHRQGTAKVVDSDKSACHLEVVVAVVVVAAVAVVVVVVAAVVVDTDKAATGEIGNRGAHLLQVTAGDASAFSDRLLG